MERRVKLGCVEMMVLASVDLPEPVGVFIFKLAFGFQL